MSKKKKNYPKATVGYGPNKMVTGVVSDSEASEAEYRICGPDSYFPDDLHGVCEMEGCGAKIVYRPFGPDRPKKICMECLVTKVLPNDDDPQFVTTSRILDDVASVGIPVIRPKAKYQA